MKIRVSLILLVVLGIPDHFGLDGPDLSLEG